MRTLVVCLALALLSTTTSVAQEQFRPALPGWTYEFPRDHGSHDDFKTEWWYYTGHLRNASGRMLGFEVTFFRVGVDPTKDQPRTAWDLRNLSLAHFAVTDISARQFRYYEKLNRSSRYTASSATGNLNVFNESWSAVALPNGAWRLRANAGDDALDLMLTTRKPPAVHGEDGISVKAEGIGYASHYYSMTRLTVTGQVTVKDKREACTGIAWMDHEFGSSSLRETQQGWDWFSIQLDNETELMIYIIRKRDGSADVTSSGSVILEDGRVMHLQRNAFRVTPLRKWKSSKSGATYPMGWRIDIPSFDIALELREELQAQELVTRGSTQVTYWEGAVSVTGRFGANSVSGVGYVELTGYDRPFVER